MNKEDFYDELGKIDQEYIEEADIVRTGRKPVFTGKKWIAVAAAFVIMVGAAGRSEAVQAAIKKLFTFIPGVGIEESEGGQVISTSTLYSMDGDPVTKTDGKITVTLMNAYINRDSVDVEYKITLDLLDGYGDINSLDELRQILDENGIEYILKNEDEPLGASLDIKAVLTIDGEAYDDLRYSGGGSLGERRNVVRADVSPEKIEEMGKDLPVALSVAGLDFDIKFKPIETYGAVEDIGPSAEVNGISITAVPRWDGDTLYVDLYDLNYSGFDQVMGFIEFDGEKNIKPYLIVNGEKVDAGYDGGDGTEFYFDLSGYSLSDDEKAALELRLPVAEVRNDENVVVPFTVHDDGTVDYPHKVSLSCCDLYITDMRRSDTEGYENGLDMDFIAVPNSENIGVFSISLSDINLRKGAKTNLFKNGWVSWGQNENNFWEIGFESERATDFRDYESVEIGSASYIIRDEFVIPLGGEQTDLNG